MYKRFFKYRLLCSDFKGIEIDLEKFRGLPDNFLVRQYVPQQQLLEHVDLFITHAGMNSVNEAICFGVPMIMLHP